MSVQMGVYPASDLACLYDDGHRHPFSVEDGQGVARTSREGDRDDRTAANRPIDHPPERGVPYVAPRQRSTSISTCSMPQPVRPRPSGALTVATITRRVVDHDRGHTYILTGISVATARGGADGLSLSELTTDLATRAPRR
jgi:hypothetical protein